MRTSPAAALMPRRVFLTVCLWLLLTCLCGIPAARAQVQIDVKLSRHTYILYEPVIATISITNLAGKDLLFEDTDGKQWFNVEVMTLEGNILPPRDPDYKLHPLTVPAGQTLRRKIDIGPLFPIREQGLHRVRANVYLPEADRFFSSNFAMFDLTDGKTFWRQTVGVPGSGELRQMSLLTHQLPDKLLLYARVRDEAGGVVYTTQALGRLVTSGNDPQEMLDRDNNLHVLQEALPGAWLYTEISLDGDRLTQKAYVKANSSRPFLAKTTTGAVAVRGGELQTAAAKLVGGDGGAAPQSKLSDRPVGIPKPVQSDKVQ